MIFGSLILILFISGSNNSFIKNVLILVSFNNFFFLAKTYPDQFPNRIDTWISRIENFNSNDNLDASYQIQRAKIAINNGGLIGVGAGKSIMKNHLPQSNSDFIFAIIVEEYGIAGGSLIIILYTLMFFRILVITHKAETVWKNISFWFRNLYNNSSIYKYSVATQIIPVTGQNLPLISSGGSSAWMTCISLGMILSVSSSIKNKNDKNRFIISGGGTGGHIYPALSIANEINKSFDNPEIKFIGARGKMEMNIIPKYGYKIHGLLISGLQGHSL